MREGPTCPIMSTAPCFRNVVYHGTVADNQTDSDSLRHSACSERIVRTDPVPVRSFFFQQARGPVVVEQNRFDACDYHSNRISDYVP